jgi:hypothetical protein
MRVYAADNPSLGTTGCVFCTDSLVDVILLALQAVQHIPAQNIHVARLG